MSKIRCYNCSEFGHFSRDCPKPRENANIARENEQNRKLAKMMDLGDNSVYKECAIICTDIYSDNEDKEIVVYSDQGISLTKYEEDMYGELMNTNRNEEKNINYNVALCTQDRNRLKIPVKELKLGVDDDASTLTTQETSVKNLVYIMNIQEESKGITNEAQNDGKNPSEHDDKKPTARTSPLEKSLPINPNDDLKDYGESGIENNQGREKEWKKKAKKMKEVTHIEFDMDDDVEMQPKNANDGKAEGKA